MPRGRKVFPDQGTNLSRQNHVSHALLLMRLRLHKIDRSVRSATVPFDFAPL